MRSRSLVFSIIVSIPIESVKRQDRYSLSIIDSIESSLHKSWLHLGSIEEFFIPAESVDPLVIEESMLLGFVFKRSGVPFDFCVVVAHGRYENLVWEVFVKDVYDIMVGLFKLFVDFRLEIFSLLRQSVGRKVSLD